MGMGRAIALIAAAVLGLTGCKTTGDAPASDRTGGATLPALSIAFKDPSWNGRAIPAGQQCSKFGGNGATPSMVVSNVPDGTAEIVVEFNDRDYAPLSNNGGHGKIGFSAGSGGSVTLPSVPGETRRLPEGARVVAPTRASGHYYVPGYLPPCSGGRGNRYFAVAKAQDAEGKTLATGQIELGRY